MKETKECKNCKISFQVDIRELNRGLRQGRPYGLFCSQSCSTKYNNAQRIPNKLECEYCKNEFTSYLKITKFCSKKCSTSARKDKIGKSNSASPTTLSTRINKALITGTKECLSCGWNKTVCDIHHIIPKSKGGTDNFDNLTILCPNCHRLIHKGFLLTPSTISDRIGLYLQSI